jgi:hypothetical protein
MRLFLCMVLVILAGGCAGNSDKWQLEAKASDCKYIVYKDRREVCITEESIWLSDCVVKIPRNADSMYYYNGYGVNDLIFMPKSNPADEIFAECEKVKPLPADKRAGYKKWLEERIQEIQSIRPGITRKQVDKILYQNGGMFDLNSVIFSHVECDVLKVRIGFDPKSTGEQRILYNDDDVVKDVSPIYLGSFILD